MDQLIFSFTEQVPPAASLTADQTVCDEVGLKVTADFAVLPPPKTRSGPVHSSRYLQRASDASGLHPVADNFVMTTGVATSPARPELQVEFCATRIAEHADEPPTATAVLEHEPACGVDPLLVDINGRAHRTLITDVSNRPRTLKACFDFVENHHDVPMRLRNVLDESREVLTMSTGRDLAELPSDPVALRPFLTGIRLKSSPTSYKGLNAFGMLQTVLTLTGWVCPEARLRYVLREPWEPLLAAASKHGKRYALGAFIRYCHRQGLNPSEISTETLIQYIEWASKWTINPAPWQAATLIRTAWNFMQTHHATWPSPPLHLPRLRVSPFAERADLRNDVLIGAGGLANRTLIKGDATRPVTLGACLDYVAAHPNVPQWFRRDALGAKAVLVRLSKRDPESLPTDPVALRPILASMEQVRVKSSKKRWQNVRTVIQSTLIMCGCISAEYRRHSVLREPWASLLSSAAQRDLNRPLAPFFRFCERENLTPEGITSATLIAYLDWLTRSTLKPYPRTAALSVQAVWRRMQRLDGTWPSTDIRLASQKIIKRRNDFCDEFNADVAAYLNSLTKYHPRDITYRHPLAPGTIIETRAAIARAATVSVKQVVARNL